MGTTLGKKDAAHKGSNHTAVGAPQTSLNPPTPPAGPVPAPYPIVARTSTASTTSSALKIGGKEVVTDKSHLDVDPPGNQPSQPTGGDVMTHATKRVAPVTSGESRTTADGDKVSATGDGVARNTISAPAESAQGPAKLVKAGGMAGGGSGGDDDEDEEAKGKRAAPAGKADDPDKKGVASGASAEDADAQGGKSGRSEDIDPNSPKTKDPVTVLTGEVTQQAIDLLLPGVIEVPWHRQYASGRSRDKTLLGRGGWALNVEQWIERDGSELRLRLDSGGSAWFPDVQAGQTWFHRRKRLEIRGWAEGYDIYDPRTRRTRRFRWHGDRALLCWIGDAWGNRIELVHQGDRLSTVRDTAGRELRLTLDEAAHLTRLDVWAATPLTAEELAQPQRPVRDLELCSSIHYAYDAAGRLVSVTDPLGHAERYAYDSSDRMIAATLKNGVTFRYEYDDTGRCVRVRGDGGLHDADLRQGDEEGEVFLSGTDEARRLVGDADGNAVLEETLDGSFRRGRTFDADGHLLSVSNAAGETTSFEYDERANLVARTDPGGNTARFEFADDLAVRRISADGHETRLSYDNHGALTSAELPSGDRYDFRYDAIGRVNAIYGASGLLMGFVYDSAHNRTEEVDARGGRNRYRYDAMGRPIERLDAFGKRSAITYDAAGQPTIIEHRDGGRTVLEYDPLGNVRSFVDPLGQSTHLEYGGTGVLTKVIEPGGQAWRFDYDRDERLTRIENPLRERYVFRYDRAGRVVYERPFDGRVLEYTYNKAERLVRIDLPDGSFRVFKHDKLGNLLTENTPHGSLQFERDERGRLLRAVVDEATGAVVTEFERDAFGRIVAEVQNGRRVGFELDQRGRRILRTLPNGATTGYAYDDLDALVELQHDGHSVRFERDAGGRETRRSSGQLLLDMEYDGVGRLLEQQLLSVEPGGSARRAIVERSYQYDANGRLARHDDVRWGTTVYAYDPLGRLSQAQRHGGRAPYAEMFEYDATGSLQSVLSQLSQSGAPPWRIEPGNVLREQPRIRYEYDACKRRRRKLETAADGSETATEYVWDCRDRLREVRLPDGRHVRFRYDAFGRRVRKTVVPRERADVVSALRAVIEGNRAAQFPAIETTEFVWDGHCLCLELRPDGQETLHVHERNTLVPVLQIQGGAVYTVVCDHLGMPKELVDTSGTVAWAAAHNAWGEVLHEQRDAGATDVRSPFRLLGQYADEETGLCYSRYRYFDPATARFLSPDPIGLRGGLNLFAFPGAPTTDTDIFGLSGYKGARKTEGETFVSWKDGDDPRFFFTAELDDDGTLKFNARTRMVDDDGNEIAKSENLSGGKLFDESVEHFGDRVKGIEGKWHFGDNLDKFNEQVGQGVPDETAAQNTWTGGKAGDHGFTQVKVKDKSPDKPGEHEKVEVLFTKPEGSE